MHTQSSRVPRVRLAVAAFLLVGLAFAGCSRRWYRKHADRNVYGLSREKVFDPRWGVPRLHMTPDARSRHFNAYDADYGPLPLDDPAAALYMRQNAWMRTYSWHKMGRALSIENPHWLAAFGLEPSELQPDDESGSSMYGDETNRESGDGPILPPRIDVPPPAPGMSRNAADRISLASYEEPVASRTEVRFRPNRGGENSTLSLVEDARNGTESEFRPTGDGESQDKQKVETDRKDEQPIDPGTLRPGLRDITLQQALELSLIHSREYQTAIETVYLAALDLSFERFQFNIRFLDGGGQKPSNNTTFRTMPHSFSNLETNSRFGVSQLLPTGAQWVVELANQTIWMFSGPDRSDTASTLSYSLVQPLLLNGGRKFVMENLTQAERNLLYAIRDLARFRRQFFSDTIAGGPSGGVLGVLQQFQTVENQKDNIRRFEIQVEQLRTLASEDSGRASEFLTELPAGLTLPGDLPEALRARLTYIAAEKRLQFRGDMNRETAQALSALSEEPTWQRAIANLYEQLNRDVLTQEVLQLESRLLSSRQTLRDAQRRYGEVIDRFKIQLGLPPDMPLSLDRSLLKQFELIDPGLRSIEVRTNDFVRISAAVNEEDPSLSELQQVADGLELLMKSVRDDALEVTGKDIDRFDSQREKRLSSLPSAADRERVRSMVDRDRRLFRGLQEEMVKIEQRLGELNVLLRYVEKFEPTVRAALAAAALSKNPGALAAAQDDAMTLDGLKQDARRIAGDIREELEKITQNAQVVQIGLRVEMIELNDFQYTADEAVALALANRVDLMNQRAFVTDARRRVEVTANQLEAMLDLVAEGDIRTRPIGANPNPLDFRDRFSEFRVGFRVNAPLDQVQQRNDYRAAQIAYEQARRAYMAFEDQVKLDIRDNWRRLDAAKKNFETVRQSIRISAMELDVAVENAGAPPPVNPTGGRGGNNAGLNLLNALGSVLNAQNSLISVWVDYERARINIYRDMGIMEVDSLGVWTDPFYQRDGKSESSTDSPTDTNAEDNPSDDPSSDVPPAPGPNDAAADRRNSKLSRNFRRTKKTGRQAEVGIEPVDFRSVSRGGLDRRVPHYPREYRDRSVRAGEYVDR